MSESKDYELHAEGQSDRSADNRSEKLKNKYKNIRQLDLSDTELVGGGNTADIYKIDEETMYKVYKPFISFEEIKREHMNSRKTFISGIPSPVTFNVFKNDEVYATKLEYLDGINLGQAFMKFPERFDELVTKYADFLKEIRTIKIKSEECTSIRDMLLGYAGNLKDYFSEDDYELVRDVLSYMPDEDTYVHGDMHTGNIMVRGDELFLIDMTYMGYGWSYYDLTQVYYVLEYVASMPAMCDLIPKTTYMSLEVGKKVCYSLLEKFYGIRLACTPIHVARLGLGILKGDQLKQLVQMTKEEFIDPVIRPNADKIKELYRDGLG